MKIKPPHPHRILVVDDVESIRLAICEHLSKEFNVTQAKNGAAALGACKRKHFDLVITDIKMPGISGIELIQRLRKDHPDTHFALMTAYNVDDFISLVRQENIWNIIPKSVFLDVDHVLVLSRKLLCSDPFGIQHYFPQVKVNEVHISDIHRLHTSLPKGGLIKEMYYTCHIATPEENRSIGTKVDQLLLASGAPPSIQLVLEELCTNALRYAKDGKSFELCFGMLNSSAVVGVLDYGGSLERKQILSYLERQVTIDPKSGLPIGLEDSPWAWAFY